MEVRPVETGAGVESGATTEAAGRTGRDPALDLLKAVGLLGIVIAHTNPPPWLFQLRNFGIPTMAFVAGAVFVESQRRRQASTTAYLRRRVQQLFVPTWTFLTVGGAVLMGLSTLLDRAWQYQPERLLRAFLLLDGATITNTQVVRVFLLLSVSAPVWMALRRRTPRLGPALAALGGIWVAYELVCWQWVAVRDDAGWLTEILVQDIGLYTVGFGIFFAFGTRSRELSTRGLLVVAAVLAVALVVFFELRGEWSPTQRWKWPPRFPYLAYAGAVGLTMAAAFRRFELARRLGSTTAIRRASSASLWLFFFHSFWLQLWNIFVGRELFLVELPVNIVGAYASLCLQQHLVGRWLARDLPPARARRIRTVFAVRS